ncbi:MAG: glycosyltransferase family 2 protein [Chlorobium phaeovibrioides]|nr:glycosyltransferase family 2 protein [Chlorobium phaeovibrioides]
MKKARFAEAIAVSDRWKYIAPPGLLWSQYRLGLYGKVSGTQIYQDHWRGLFARAVSYAACANHEKASETANVLAERFGDRKDFFLLANALAAFMPEYALELIENRPAPLILRVALLQKNKRYDESDQLLRFAFGEGQQRDNPELYLYLSNAWSWSSPNKLDYLNSYLQSFRLNPVTLVDNSKTFSLRHFKVFSDDIQKVKNGPLVSILMTTYENESHVDYAISSILEQSWQNIELIIVDDASTDSTVQLLTAWVIRDDRVRVIRLKQNVGTYVAKNIGLRYAQGEFVTCHDSDDWSHPLKIERQVAPLLYNKKLVGTTSNWVRMQDDGTYFAMQVYPLQRLNSSSLLFRRKEVLETTGAWDCVRTGADSEFAARLKLVFGRKAVLAIRQPLALGAHRPGSLMTDAHTGYTAGRVPPDRLDYWESWTWWQINELRAKRKPRMPSMTEARAFKAPEAIVVPQESIEQCMREAALYSPMGVREYAVD